MRLGKTSGMDYVQDMRCPPKATVEGFRLSLKVTTVHPQKRVGDVGASWPA